MSEVEKYCCNCSHWRGRGLIFTEDEFNKCYAYIPSAFTRYDQHCNEFIPSNDGYVYEDYMSKEKVKRIELSKAAFEFRPCEYIPKDGNDD